MKFRICLFVAVCVLGCASVHAQVVQLPSIRQFSYRGSVLVPDGGSTYLGGNRSYASGSRSRGLPGLPAVPGSQFGNSTTASGLSVSATIIDHEAIDRQIRGQDARSLSQSIHHRNEPSIDRQIDEIKSLVRNARSLHQSGRAVASRYTYDLAINRIRRLRLNRNAPHEKLTHMLAYANHEYSRLYSTSGMHP